MVRAVTPAIVPNIKEGTNMLMLSIGTGFWIFFAFLLVMRFQKRIANLPDPTPLPPTTTDDQKNAAAAEASKSLQAKVKYGIAWALLLVGVAALVIVAATQVTAIRVIAGSCFASVSSLFANTTPLGWAKCAIWTVPAIYLFVLLVYKPKGRDDDSGEKARARYIDSVKTLITAAGLTIGAVISTSLKPDVTLAGWATTISDGVVALTLSIGCSVLTLFILSVFYDISNKEAIPRKFFVIVAPVWYFAMTMFFTGFIHMVKLTKLLVDLPKTPGP